MIGQSSRHRGMQRARPRPILPDLGRMLTDYRALVASAAGQPGRCGCGASCAADQQECVDCSNDRLAW